MAPAGAAWQRSYRNCGRPAGTIWQSIAWPLQGLRGKGTIETVVALQVLYGKVLHGPCRGCKQRYYRNCDCPAGTIWQSTTWPLQGLRGKGTIETVVALQVLYGKVLHGPCRGCVAKVPYKLWLRCRYYVVKYCMAPAGAAWQRKHCAYTACSRLSSLCVPFSVPSPSRASGAGLKPILHREFGRPNAVLMSIGVRL